MGGDPTPRSRSTPVPFLVGAGPTRLPKARCPGIIPLAVVAAPLHWVSAVHYSDALSPSRCIRVVAAAVVTYGTSSFGSARYSGCAGPPNQAHIRVTVQASRIRVCAGPRPRFRKDRQDFSLGVPRPASPVPSTWMGLTAFSRKLPEWGKKPLTTRCALTTIVLAVLVCLFTGSYQL